MPMTARSIGTSATSMPASSAYARSGDVQADLQRGDGDVGERLPSRTTSSRPSRSAEAIRSSSWRRSPRSTRMPACGSGARPAACRQAPASAAALPRLELGVVGEQPQRLRRAGQQRGDVLAGAEQLGEPLGHLALVAQQPQEPLVAAERLADLAVGQQARRRGSGRTAKVCSSTGSRYFCIDADRETPPVSAPRCRSAPSGSAKPRARSQSPAAFEPELQVLAGHAGHRRQQRPVEELLVQPAHLAGVQARARPAARRRPRRGGRACSPATGPASAAAARRWAAGGCAAAAAAAAGARRCAGTGRRRSASRRRPGRRTRRPTAPCSAGSVPPTRSDASARPCTICSSWTANSTSRSPPRPSLSSRSACAGGMLASTRRRIACTSATKPGRSPAFHTSGQSAST